MTARTLFRNARLLDPATGLDQKGNLLVADGKIAALGPRAEASGAVIIDCRGHCLAPGLVDMRVELREPGREHEETMESGSAAAAAGGVTTMVALPNTEPAIDDVALVEFVARRSREIGRVNIRTYAAATRGLKGKEITEIGLLSASGALAFTDAGTAIADTLALLSTDRTPPSIHRHLL